MQVNIIRHDLQVDRVFSYLGPQARYSNSNHQFIEQEQVDLFYIY